MKVDEATKARIKARVKTFNGMRAKDRQEMIGWYKEKSRFYGLIAVTLEKIQEGRKNEK
ncbi:MAG: hypothetical protein BAJALOKI1v1_2440004 [Promethearchaeota archaeon]|nr:MAG: hypothetical protein BAJALOKI1v1_2440004 [Candidatus Lokiarchaeota archaeon]